MRYLVQVIYLPGLSGDLVNGKLAPRLLLRRKTFTPISVFLCFFVSS